jgi:hypothetical protein
MFAGGRFTLAVGRWLGFRAVLRVIPAAGAGGFGRASACADSSAGSAEAEPDLAGADGFARAGPWVPGAAEVVGEVAGEAQLGLGAYGHPSVGGCRRVQMGVRVRNPN